VVRPSLMWEKTLFAATTSRSVAAIMGTAILTPETETRQDTPRFVPNANAYQVYTSLACVEQDEPITCAATNSATGEQYDLSALSRFGTNWRAVNTGTRAIYINVCQDLAEETATAMCPGGAAVCV
jgi:hypothetical protein